MIKRLSWSPAPSKSEHLERGLSQTPNYPLHRTFTDENAYNDKPSAITQFVSKLLGFSPPRQRPRLEHKSHSTTSITKAGAVISSAHYAPVSVSVSVSDGSSDIKSVSNPGDTRLLSQKCIHRRSFSCGCSPSSPAIDALVAASKKKQRLVTFLDTMESLQLVNRRPDTEPVLTTALADQLRPYLPRRYRLASEWVLLYSLDQHGTSLHTLYRLTKANKGPVLLVIKDADDQIFGAFLNETLKPTASYYGTGECFLWKSVPSLGTIKVFPWTGKNEYMILSEYDFIAIGGGDGKFGMWINSDLEKGHSEPCPTFDNEALSPSPEFTCLQLEVWGFRI